MHNIQVLGLDDFNDNEKKDIMDISMKHYKRIQRELPGVLWLHAKKHDKAGKRCKYSFHAKVKTTINIINVEESDWNLHKALHKLLIKVEDQIKHKYKI